MHQPAKVVEEEAGDDPVERAKAALAKSQKAKGAVAKPPVRARSSFRVCFWFGPVRARSPLHSEHIKQSRPDSGESRQNISSCSLFARKRGAEAALAKSRDAKGTVAKPPVRARCFELGTYKTVTENTR